MPVPACPNPTNVLWCQQRLMQYPHYQNRCTVPISVSEHYSALHDLLQQCRARFSLSAVMLPVRGMLESGGSTLFCKEQICCAQFVTES